MARSVRNLTEVVADLDRRGITLAALVQNVDTARYALVAPAARNECAE
jgi:hypothetical protein